MNSANESCHRASPLILECAATTGFDAKGVGSVAIPQRAGNQTPRDYETKFDRVIDPLRRKGNRGCAQDLKVATEDRALLRTHLERRCGPCKRAGVAAYGRPTGPEPETCRSKSKSVKSQGGSGRQSHSIPSMTHFCVGFLCARYERIGTKRKIQNPSRAQRKVRSSEERNK